MFVVVMGFVFGVLIVTIYWLEERAAFYKQAYHDALKTTRLVQNRADEWKKKADSLQADLEETKKVC